MSTPALLLEQLRFRYPASSFRFEFQRRQELAAGGSLACIGPSGCGKTTLLNLIGGILPHQNGRLEVLGQALQRRSDPWRRSFRLARLGMVFQEFELLEYLDGRANILLPLRLAGAGPEQMKRAADDLAPHIERLGLEHVMDSKPATMSQGERQRVALARALVTRPALLLCDEPTGNLDAGNTRRTMDLLFSYCEESGAALVLVTHDHALLERFDQVLELDAGRRA